MIWQIAKRSSERRLLGMRQPDFRVDLQCNDLSTKHKQLTGGGGGGGERLVVCHVYLVLCDFARRFLEERGPGREKVFFGVFLQTTVATAHRAIPRHLRTKLDSNSATSTPSSSSPPKNWTVVSLNSKQAIKKKAVCAHTSRCLLSMGWFPLSNPLSRVPIPVPLLPSNTLALLHRHGHNSFKSLHF